MGTDHDRRRLLQGLVAGALAASPLGRAAARAVEGSVHGSLSAEARDRGPDPEPPPPHSPRATVCRAHRAGLMAGGRDPDPALLASALGSAVARAAGDSTPVGAFRRLFRPADVVGIKVNCMAGRGLSSHPALVHLLAGWLQEAGVQARDILIWDRTDRELRAAGYVINRTATGVRIFGTEKDYEASPRAWGSGASHFARFLVEDLTALINVGVIKDHNLAGTALGLKSWYGAIDNPRMFHDNGCNPHVARLASHPIIARKVRLTILDGLVAQCHGGPVRNPVWTWPLETILASTDPVSIDAVASGIVEDRRADMRLPSLATENRPPRSIAEAARLGLGESDPARIRVEEV